MAATIELHADVRAMIASYCDVHTLRQLRLALRSWRGTCDYILFAQVSIDVSPTIEAYNAIHVNFVSRGGDDEIPFCCIRRIKFATNISLNGPRVSLQMQSDMVDFMLTMVARTQRNHAHASLDIRGLSEEQKILLHENGFLTKSYNLSITLGHDVIDCTGFRGELPGTFGSGRDGLILRDNGQLSFDVEELSSNAVTNTADAGHSFVGNLPEMSGLRYLSVEVRTIYAYHAEYGTVQANRLGAAYRAALRNGELTVAIMLWYQTLAENILDAHPTLEAVFVTTEWDFYAGAKRVNGGHKVSQYGSLKQYPACSFPKGLIDDERLFSDNVSIPSNWPPSQFFHLPCIYY
ncbi:hypothetical protein NLG97_g9308 [Lecanicillium saksenae]|uniref:Uncharacterized protein n=1 Tax=Lecanicillium saksenae TaxID=468837 RepID=A0ACC1QIV5_9HYPO|nr:hypothetical protein NLG97_g9308 [Lecanicillium saksenae]